MDAKLGDVAAQSSLPSFMKPTASRMSRLSTTPDRDKDKAVDAAALVSRDTVRAALPSKQQDFSLSTKNTAIPRTPPSAKSGIKSSYFLAGGPGVVGEIDDSWERVKVFARVRPPLWEDERGGAVELDPNDPQRIMVRREGLMLESQFKFDCILGPSSTQQDVYSAAVRPIVEDVLLGYNGTVMAYGQTGAGKTYTLANMDPEAIGTIPRALADVFNHAASDVTHTYRVFMSYVQIYMEIIKDLLVPSAENLQIREDHNGVFLANVHEEQVSSTQECLKLLQRGEQNRIFASTEMNAHSSRSHAIVIVTVFKQRKRAMKQAQNGQDVVGKATTMGRMFLVDLAGSERLKKSKSVGVRAAEAKAINLSLTTLGMCVNARTDPNAAHVPFRDSKLTRLLQESLGGNAKTSMIIAVSDVLEHADETFQSCLFGSRAILVRTAPRVNQFLDLSAMNDQIIAQLGQVDPENALERALMDREEKLERLEAMLADERSKATSTATEWKQRLERATSTLNAAKRERDEAKMSFVAATATHTGWCKEAEAREARLVRDIATLKDEVNSAHADVRARNDDILHLRLEAEVRSKEAQQASTRANDLETELDRAKHISETLRDQLDGARAALSRQKDKAEADSALNEQLHAAKVDQLQDQHADQVTRLQKELADVRAAADGDKAALHSELEAAKAQREEFWQEAQSLAEEVGTLQGALEAEQQRSAEALASARLELDAERDELAQARRRIEELEATVQELEQKVKEQSEQLQNQDERYVTAVLRHGDVRRLNNAAITIQRQWRWHVRRQMVQEGQTLRLRWDEERKQLSAEQRRAAAQTGATLVQNTLGLVESTVNALLMEMLLPSKAVMRVKAAQKAAGVASASPQATTLRPALSRTFGSL